MGRFVWILPLVLLAGASSPAPAGIAAHAGAAPELPAVAAFNRRVQIYYAQHRELEGPVHTVKVSSDPAVIRHAIDALGGKLRVARRGVRQGNIFAADIVPLFRHWIRVQCQNNFATLVETTGDGAEPVPKPVVLNEKWPGDVSDYLMPDPLCKFPALPDGLEYRFMLRDLVLWDSHADLVVDLVRDAIPKGTAPVADIRVCAPADRMS